MSTIQNIADAFPLSHKAQDVSILTACYADEFTHVEKLTGATFHDKAALGAYFAQGQAASEVISNSHIIESASENGGTIRWIADLQFRSDFPKDAPLITAGSRMRAEGVITIVLKDGKIVEAVNDSKLIPS